MDFKFRVAWIILGLGLTACSKESRKFNLSHPHRENQLLLNLQPGMNLETLLRRLQAAEPDADIQALNGQTVLIKFAEDVDLEAKGEQLIAASSVRSIEANVIYQLDEIIPNDPSFSRLYGMKNAGKLPANVGADIKATFAWDATTGSREVLVAVIDSGVDYTHQDLNANIWINPGESGVDAEGRNKSFNGIDDDVNGFVDDYHGWDFVQNDNNPMDDNSHGTHVAGTIGATGDNGLGVVGVNWFVSMLPIKVFSVAGESTTEALVRGIDYATRMNVAVSNNSWGGDAFSEAILAAIQRANAAGILFVTAAGNNGSNNDEIPHYPSSYDASNIISVASTDQRDRLDPFSNYGRFSVDIAAPGVSIYSTIPGDKYGFKSGTSMACPHVAGLAALLKARYPSLNVTELRTKILQSAAKPMTIASAVINGRLDAFSAFDEDNAAPNAVSDLSLSGIGVHDLGLTWTRSGDDGDLGAATSYQVRFAADPIVDDDTWAAAQRLNFTSFEQVGTNASASIRGLAYNSTGFLAIRALDNVSNMSTLSTNLEFYLVPSTLFWNETNETLSSWQTIAVPWGLSRATNDSHSWLSDSPTGKYANNSNTTITSFDFNIENDELTLEIRSKHEFENDFDFGFIELSTDQGASWRELAKFTGNASVYSSYYQLKPILAGARRFKVRLRVQSDASTNFNGWDIENIKIVGAVH